MLTLTRKRDEQVMITLEDGRTLKVMVSAIKGDRVQLSFEAPRTIQINREEIYLAEKRAELDRMETAAA